MKQKPSVTRVPSEANFAVVGMCTAEVAARISSTSLIAQTAEHIGDSRTGIGALISILDSEPVEEAILEPVLTYARN